MPRVANDPLAQAAPTSLLECTTVARRSDICEFETGLVSERNPRRARDDKMCFDVAGAQQFQQPYSVDDSRRAGNADDERGIGCFDGHMFHALHILQMMAFEHARMSISHGRACSKTPSGPQKSWISGRFAVNCTPFPCLRSASR